MARRNCSIMNLAMLPLEMNIPKVPDVIDPCMSPCGLVAGLNALIKHLDSKTREEITPVTYLQGRDGDARTAMPVGVEGYTCIGYEYNENGAKVNEGEDTNCIVTLLEGLTQEVVFLYEAGIKPGNVLMILDVSNSMNRNIANVSNRLLTYLQNLKDEDRVWIMMYESTSGTRGIRSDWLHGGHGVPPADARTAMGNTSILTLGQPNGVGEGIPDGQMCNALIKALSQTNTGTSYTSIIGITDRPYDTDNLVSEKDQAMADLQAKITQQGENIDLYMITAEPQRLNWESAPMFNKVIDTFRTT